MKKFSCKQGEIAYSSVGNGTKNFCLIHNAGGSHEMMAYTAAHFAKAGKVLSLDLLGHGSSSKLKTEYTLPLFAETALELCRHQQMEKVVLIGLNFGANVGIEIAKIEPKRLSHLILIEPPLFMESWIRTVVEAHIEEKENSEEELVDSVIYKATAEVRAVAIKAMKSTPGFVKSSTYRNLLQWDQNHEFLCSIPSLLIQTAQPFCSEEKARQVLSNLHVGRVVGTGPWANLESPDQVHTMIDRFLEIT